MQNDSGIAIQDGALENKAAAGKGQEGVVRRWMLEISLADKLEKDWRKTANTARDIYRGKKKSQNSFNILWANTEVIRPNLYNSMPNPDVRRRYRDADPVGKAVAEVLERALSFEADSCDFDGEMDSAVMDSCLPGRGTFRIRFEPNIDDQGALVGAKTYPEAVEWDEWRRGPASKWKDVPWLAYEHALTMDEVKAKFPGYETKVQYDIVLKGASEENANREPTVYKRVRFWEVWDKEKRQILWIAPSYEAAPVLVEEDKLKLADFFDMPKPMYAVNDTSSLEPICEYSLYEDQAKELNRVTDRINKLTNALKVRGVYDATLAEMATLMSSDDNDMIPTTDSTIALQAGGFDKAIWIMPIEQIAKVLAQLYIQREQIKMTIYEVIGISDILRGATDPNETLGAQELKAQNGSVRLQRRQRDVQRFARDAFRIMAEIIAEHYPAELLTVMTGVSVTPEMQQVLQRDLLRGIHVDVETDSTIAADQAKTRKDMAEVMEAVGGFVTNFGPAVQEGAISIEAAKKILISIIRKAKLGRDVEDALEQDAAQPPQPKPNPEMQKMQMEQEARQADLQMKQQEFTMKQQDAQASMQLEGEKLRLEEGRIAAEQQLAHEKMQMEMDLKREQMALEAQFKQQQMAQDAELRREAEHVKANTAMETERMRGESASKSKPSASVQLGSDEAVAQLGEQLSLTLAEGQKQMAESIGSAVSDGLMAFAKANGEGFQALAKTLSKTRIASVKRMPSGELRGELN